MGVLLAILEGESEKGDLSPGLSTSISVYPEAVPMIVCVESKIERLAERILSFD
jgi:hypothetical protein